MGLIRDLKITRHRKEIAAYVNGLQALDDNLIGKWVAEAIILRMKLESSYALPRSPLFDGSISPGIANLRLMSKALHKSVGLLKQDDIPSRSHLSLINEQLLNLWIFTINALLYPELKEEGNDMWAEMERGMPFVPTELDKVIARKKEEKDALPHGSRKKALDILKHLPPEGLEPMGPASPAKTP